MDALQQIETQAEKIATIAKALSNQCLKAGAGGSPFLWESTGSEVPDEGHRLRYKMLASISNLQTMLAGPTDFIQQLTHQAQILACLRWLAEFQVLACIPLHGEIATKDLAELVAVPETQLGRVLRLMVATGFLQEPQPGSGQVAHTGLSASFVTDVPNLDAAMFLGSTAVPSALQMPEATHRRLTGYSLAANTGVSFVATCEQQPRLQRQWAAYLSYLGDSNQMIVNLLSRLDWESLGNACIVDVDATSTRIVEALSERHTALYFVVQMSESVVSNNSTNPMTALHPRITVQLRLPQSTQTIEDAAVYLLRGESSGSGPMASWVQVELQCHLGLLRANPNAMLLLALQLRPDPGFVDPGVEAAACLRDMAMAQLIGDSREMTLTELEEIVSSVRDSGGRLVVMSKLQSHHCSTIALCIRYRAKSQPQQLGLTGSTTGWSVTSP